MASYISSLWRSLTGNARPAFNEADFLDALRPRTVLKTPKRLPTTPTWAHLPPKRPVPSDHGKKSKQCGHCRKTIYLELPSGRISKPAGTRKGRAKGKGSRWVNVDDSYKIEDLSPVLSGRWNCIEEIRDEVRCPPRGGRTAKASTKKGMNGRETDSSPGWTPPREREIRCR